MATVCLAIVAALAMPVAGADVHLPAKGPCALLKKAEIAQVFAADVGKGKKRQPGPACAWKVGGGSAVAGGGEIVTVLDRGRSAQNAFDLGAQLEGGTPEPVDGLGRQAEYLPALDTLFVLATKKALISVQGVFPSPEASTTTSSTAPTRPLVSTHRDQLVALAALAVARV
jgi:hypothetical protein